MDALRKDRHPLRALLVENIHTVAANRLEAAGFQVERLSKALSENEVVRIAQ